MKKILPILILSAAAVFLLSSCDQMLEALFPAETGQLHKTDNTITFTVVGQEYYSYSAQVPGYGYGWWAYKDQYGNGPYTTYGTRPVIVQLWDSSGNTLLETKSATFGSFNSSNQVTATVTFNNESDGSYTFKVWYDADNDGSSYLESTYYNYYYYNTYGYVNGSTVSNVGINGGVTANVTVNLYEYTY